MRWGFALAVLGFACQRPAMVSAPQAPRDRDGKGSATATGVRYALPTCPLSYQVLVRERSSLDGELQFDTERFMSLEATAQSGRLQLDAVVVGRSIHDGVRAYGKPDDTYAPPLLETDGLGWAEREGPTWLFSSVGAQGGLAWFFPTLPASADRGASVVWSVPFASGQSTAALRTEATRGHMRSLAFQLAERADAGEQDVVIPTTFTRAEVRFEDSNREQGVLVSSFSMTGARELASEPNADFAFKTVSTYRGTYAVTERGRILRAHVEARHAMTNGNEAVGTVQHHVQDVDAKMHLVRACDGPVAPSLEPILTAEERAMPADDSLRIELPPPKKK